MRQEKGENKRLEWNNPRERENTQASKWKEADTEAVRSLRKVSHA